MPKRSSSAPNSKNVLIIILVIFVVLSNLIWLVVIREQQRQINQVGNDHFNTLVNLGSLRDCYDKDIKPCPDPPRINFPK